MKINWSKVLLGGVVAGVVMVAVDFVNNKYLLGPKSNAELDAFKPGLSATMQNGNALVLFLLFDVVLGIILVWTYAAIRPRFGPGPGTAVKAAIPYWVAMCIAYYGYMEMGMMSSGTWWGFGAVGLISFILASLVGAKLYSEEGTT